MILRVLPVLALTGCVGSLCRGAGCEDVFPAGQLLVLDPFVEEVARSSTSLATLSGTTDEGADWAVAGVGDTLFVGMPGFERVVRWRPGEDEDALGGLANWRGPLTELGHALAVADIGDNGVPDLWVAAPGAELDAGALVLWLDARQGARTADAQTLLVGPGPGDRLGQTMVVCPDLSGDGAPDLVVAAPGLTAEGRSRAGGVFVLPSQEQFSGILQFSEWRSQAVLWHAEEAGAAAGTALACGEDLTGDGVPDIVIGAPGLGEQRQGGVFVISGASPPPSGPLPAPTRVGSREDSWLGSSLAVGDMDGDGVGELAVGAPGTAGGAGEVELFYGPDLDVPRTVIEPPTASEPVHLGRSLLIDALDDDLFDDLIVGAEDAVNGEDFDAGLVGVFQGSDVRLAPNLVLDQDQDWIIGPDHAFQRLGAEMRVTELGLVLAVRSRGF